MCAGIGELADIPANLARAAMRADLYPRLRFAGLSMQFLWLGDSVKLAGSHGRLAPSFRVGSGPFILRHRSTQ